MGILGLGISQRRPLFSAYKFFIILLQKTDYKELNRFYNLSIINRRNDMKKYSIFLAAVISVLNIHSHAVKNPGKNRIALASQIDKVLVYQDRALITRNSETLHLNS